VKITIQGAIDETKFTNQLATVLEAKKYQNIDISTEVGGDKTKISLKTEVENDERVATLSKDIQDFLIKNGYISDQSKIIEQSVIGPSVGGYMQKTAKNAIIIGLILMAIYMLFSFAAIRKVISPSTLAIVTIITMIFDVSLPAGAYGIWMWMDKTIMVDSVFIIALLANMGYSINDTIIIFDRIRENVVNKGLQKGALFGKIFEESLRQTMRRSFGTLFSTLLVIIAMFILGTGVIKSFAFTIGMGVLFGSYSSIFIAAPLAYILIGKYRKEHKEMKTVK
jgi:SecD/SecF fusion protein